MPRTSSGWSKPFEDPIEAGGKTLTSLRDAATYIAALPAKEAEAAHWQLAIETLIMAAENRGPVLHAQIAVNQALNHGRPAPEKPPRRKAIKKYRVIR